MSRKSLDKFALTQCSHKTKKDLLSGTVKFTAEIQETEDHPIHV